MTAKGEQTNLSQTEKYPVPEFLYKYSKLNEDNREWIQRIFTHNEIYFASPERFNDPFDCRVQASFDASDDDWEEHLDGVFKVTHPNWDYNERQALVRRAIEGGWLKEAGAQQKIVNDVQNAVNKLGVFCLSETQDDILMWSHYGDGHKGFCLQFCINLEQFPFVKLYRVEYTVSYPQINVVKYRETQTRSVLLTKSDFWKYEKEWRIIDDKGPGIRVFPAEMLTGVTFGCEMPHESRQLIRKWAKGRKVPLKFCQATKKEKEFGLDIIKAIG